MLTTKDGINFQAQINYSNRFGFIAIYELGCEYGHSFSFDEQKAKLIESDSSPSEIDKVILSLYKGKHGKRC